MLLQPIKLTVKMIIKWLLLVKFQPETFVTSSILKFVKVENALSSDRSSLLQLKLIVNHRKLVVFC